jgi:predicted SAM-dependent methyltransferase
MTNFIAKKYYGKNSPVLALEYTNGNEQFKLPENACDQCILEILVGTKGNFDPGILTDHVKTWLYQIHLYLDVPILGLLSKEFNMESKEWWTEFMKCPGHMLFLEKYDYTVKSVHIANMCAIKGNINILKWIIKNKGSCHINTALYYACENGHLECAKWCVENGANDFNTALRYACMHGQLECAKFCVENSATNVNLALTYSCLNGHLECSKFCVENGATNVNLALTYSCLNGHLACAKFCVESGATKCTFCGGHKHTFL